MSQEKTDANMNPAELYREEHFTDQKIGTIRRLTPVTPEGEVDTNRDVLYSGSTQIMTPMGALPINFNLEASTIGEAAEKFGPEAELAVERTAKEMEEMRREQASKIVIPGQEGGMGGMPGGGIIT
ncbi:MAG: hypothetical protein COA46_10585 [Porticoccaceae bacterium]|nr:MAG: hypothetical protein COA46_10585 [Porticoccaceae bacterium]